MRGEGLGVRGAEWPDEEKLRFEKETLGFYITGHPLNRYADDLALFAKGVNTETLYRFIDETVNIGGIVSQIKRSKIKKGPNEGKLMAKFVLDDQYGSVDVVVFSDLYGKYAKWLDNGVAVLLTGGNRLQEIQSRINTLQFRARLVDPRLFPRADGEENHVEAVVQIVQR